MYLTRTVDESILFGPIPVIHKDLAKLGTLRIVDSEDGDGRASDLRPTDQHGSEPLEVTSPDLTARVEELDHAPCERIDPAQVRPLVKVASVAAPRAVLGFIRPAMLPGNDVFDVECRSWRSEIGEVTIFAAAVGPVANELAKGPWHQATGDCLSSDRALAWRIAMKSSVWT